MEELGETMRVMICVDNSRHAESAFEFYVRNMHKPKNKVLILHVSDKVKIPPYLYAGRGGLGAYLTIGEINGLKTDIGKLRQANRDLKRRYDARCKDRNIDHQFILAFADSDAKGGVMVKTAEEHGARLIVTGSRELRTMKRAILGSASSYVMRHTRIPTLVCPSKE